MKPEYRLSHWLEELRTEVGAHRLRLEFQSDAAQKAARLLGELASEPSLIAGAPGPEVERDLGLALLLLEDGGLFDDARRLADDLRSWQGTDGTEA